MTRYPALELWRAEVAAGIRSLATIDAVWRAACAEMWAIEHDALGLQQAAADFRDEAANIVRAAAAAQVRQRTEHRREGA